MPICCYFYSAVILAGYLPGLYFVSAPALRPRVFVVENLFERLFAVEKLFGSCFVMILVLRLFSMTVARYFFPLIWTRDFRPEWYLSAIIVTCCCCSSCSVSAC